MKYKHYLLCVSLTSLCAISQADVLVGYDFETTDGYATLEASVLGDHVSASNFKTGVGLTVSFNLDSAPADGVDAEGNAFAVGPPVALGGTSSQLAFDDMDDADDLTAAILANDYLEFTVNAANGYSLNLESLSFRTYVEQLINSAERWALFSSVDGYAGGSEIATGQTTAAGSWTGTSNNIVVDLSAAKFQAQGSVSFRLYIYGGDAEANSTTLFDKVVVNGSTTKSEILVGYDFDASAPDMSVATLTADKLTASALTSPMDIAFVTSVGDDSGLDADGETFGSPSTLGCVGIGVNDATTASFAAAVAANEYVSFTVTPDDGVGFHLSRLSFKATKKHANSVDEYAVTDAQGNMIGSAVQITNVVGLTGAYDSVIVDLTGTNYEYIADPTEFRLYAWGRGSSSTSGTLAAIDKVALYGEPVNVSGRNSHFWITLKPEAGTTSGADSDLVLANGYRSVNLSSPDLSCTRVDNGTSWVYNISWTGNSLLGDERAETLEFSVVVDAFSGASYVYSTNNGTVSSLGTADSPRDTSNRWGVGTDNDIDAGQSIRMTQQDFKVDGTDLSTNGLLLENTFTSMSVAETNAGYDHKIIFGEGTNLATASFNQPSATYGIEGEAFSVTGAGSNANNREWAITSVKFNFVVRNPALTVEDPDNPFADLPNGHSFGPTPYAPTTQAKLDNAFPNFSWDRVPRTMLVRKASQSFTADEAERIANHYDFVVLEKANGGINGYYDKAAALKAYNPDIKVVFYWNSRIYYGHNNVDDSINDNWDEYIDPDFTIRDGLSTYQQNNPDLIDWWVGVCNKMMGLEAGYASNGTALQPSPIDGTFIDKTGVPSYMLQPLYEGATDDKFIMNNNAGNRNRLPYLDGTYREGWSDGGSSSGVAEAIAIAQESGRNQKLTMLRNPTSGLKNKREMEDAVDYVLGVYLSYAEEYAYFYHQQSVDATDSDWQWLTDYYDQFQRPLGQPLGDAIKDNYIYSRSFEHCDLYLDLDTDTGGKLSRILWKNDVGNPTLAGSGASSTSDTYTLQGSGNLSGTADNFFFLSDLHYGNGEVVAKVDSLDNTHADAKAGVMFRERNEPVNEDDLATDYSQGNVLVSNTRTVTVVRNPAGQMEMLYRDTVGGNLLSAGTADASFGPYVGIARGGDSFTGYCSPDGVNWTELGEVTIALPEKVEMGMVVASHNSSALASASFSQFSRAETEPNAEPQSVSVDEDSSVVITLTGSDPHGADLTYTVLNDPSHGVLTGTAPNLTYTPDPNYFGSDSFTFRVNDGFTDSNTATVSITVDSVDDAPVFGTPTATAAIKATGSYSGSLVGSATDVDGDPLSYSIVSGPSWLSLATDGSLSGTPGSADLGPNSWTIEVTDGNGTTQTTTLHIAVVDQVLVGYDFDTGASDWTEPTVESANLSASQFTSPMAIGYVSGNGDTSGIDAAGVDFGDASTLGCVGIQVVDAITSSFAAAVAGEDYMSFTLTPDAGAMLHLNAITFKVGMKSLTSVDEYALADAAGNLIGNAAMIPNANGLGGAYESVTVNLTGTAYETLTEATEFRIYAWGRGTTNTANTLAALDKVTVYGSVSEILAGYDFTSGSNAATTVASAVTASDLSAPMAVSYPSTVGDNTGLNAHGVEFGSPSELGVVGIGVDDATASSFASAVAGDDYLAFTITPNTGVELQLSSITFLATKKHVDSVDEYAVTDAAGNLIGGPFVVTNVVGLTGVYDGIIVDLSGTTLESITQATELRIYAWGRGSTSTANTLAALDKVTLHGRVKD